MKLKNQYLSKGLQRLVLLFLVFYGLKINGQCSVSVTYSANPSGNGQVSFSSIVTNSLGPINYTWSFGGGGVPSLTGTMFPNPIVTYTASGFYTVNVSIQTGSCFNTYSLSVAVAVCNMSFSHTPTSGTLCTGSATPFLSGMCPPLSYVWAPSSHTMMTDTSMCAGVHGLTVTSTANSPTCCPSISGTVNILTNNLCPLNASFTHSIQPYGYVTFYNTSTGVNPQTTYTLDFGDGTNVTGTNFTQFTNAYTANALYYPLLILEQPGIPGCIDSTTIPISVTNYTPCTLVPQFSTNTTGSSVTFVSTSQGTTPSSIYTWHFGDGSLPLSGTSHTVMHTYTTTGVFNTLLSVDNNSTIPGCMDSTAVQTITIAGCLLKPDFTYTQTAIKTVHLRATSTATTNNTNHSWFFGDGQNGIGDTVTHTYQNGGVYTVTLIAKNDTTCFMQSSKPINIDTLCLLNAVFLHTVGASGVVNFNALTTGTLYNYFWNFGDGTSAIVPNPTHTYASGGTHYVKLVVSSKQQAFCKDSLTLAINITGIPCVANSNFTLIPTATPKYWTAVPAYPYNITAAKWTWGDGKSTDTLITSHTYTAAALYSICLSVTVSCGATSTTCGNYSIYKTSGGAELYYVNVKAPPIQVSVEEEIAAGMNAVFYPNPTQGIVNVKLGNVTETTYSVLDLSGITLISGISTGENEFKIILSGLSAGMYLIELRSESGRSVSRIIVSE